MQVTSAMLIEEDCKILLERALLRKSVCAFGEDGFGLHGRNDIASWFVITEVDVAIVCDDDDEPTTVCGSVALTLAGYNSEQTGLIMTDKNFEISLATLLRAASIDPACLLWPADTITQGKNWVDMDIDVGLLLGWA